MAFRVPFRRDVFLVELNGFIGFYWVLPGFTGFFYWVSLGSWAMETLT